MANAITAAGGRDAGKAAKIKEQAGADIFPGDIITYGDLTLRCKRISDTGERVFIDDDTKKIYFGLPK